MDYRVVNLVGKMASLINTKASLNSRRWGLGGEIYQCLSKDVEYSPGVILRVGPVDMNKEMFYPANPKASTVEIILEDGKRLMDKCLFENLYLISKNPDSSLFLDSKEYFLPFTSSQFDHFIGRLIDPHFLEDYADVFLNYFKITNFLMPKVLDLYAIYQAPQGFIHYLDISLDIIPDEITEKLLVQISILGYSQYPEVIKRVFLAPEKYLKRERTEKILTFMKECKATVLQLHLDYQDFVKRVSQQCIQSVN